MIYIVLFSLTIALFTITHSLGLMICVIFLVFVLSYYKIWRFTFQRLILYSVVIWCGIASVVYYDWKTIGNWDDLILSYQWLYIVPELSGDEIFVVSERERHGRYTIIDTTRDLSLVLYTTASLSPWDVITTKAKPLRRTYYPQLCISLCRQSRQVMDNDSFDYDRWLYMQGLDWSLYDNSVFIIDYQDLSILGQVRESFFQTVVSRFGKTITAWLILGMTIGDRSLIEDERYNQFISSGLVHLIAVSGGNIAIVVIFVGMLLFWLPFYLRQGVLILAVIWYAMIVGNDSSVIRATMMWLLTLFAIFPWRQLSIWRSLAYARCGMLFYNPYYLIYDLWFGLSFSAVIGIVVAEYYYKRYNSSSEKIKNRLSLIFHKIVSLYIVPTIGAMIWVLPLLLYTMPQTNILSPFINMLIVPFVPLLTVLWFVIPYIWGNIFSTMMIWSMDYIVWLSMVGSRYGLFIVVDQWLQYILLSVVLLIWIWWLDRQYTLPTK